MMPIYEYSCSHCNQDFELLVRGSETPQCPQCGGTRLEKLLSVPAAPGSAKGSLPVCEAPAPPMCSRPQCGGGQCMGEM